MATLAEALGSLDDPKVRHIVSLSGGKDSTALAIHLKQQYPQIPAEYVFCDTGTELPETYDYLARLEAYLGKRVVRLDALDVLRVRRKSGRTAFDIYLNEVFSGFLPESPLTLVHASLEDRALRGLCRHATGPSATSAFVGTKAVKATSRRSRR